MSFRDRLLPFVLPLVLALAVFAPASANDVDGPDDCQRPSQDFGDAPEAVMAYPGIPGRFPTCLFPGPAGTQELACPPISLPPGITGWVRHVNPEADAFWLGCPPGGPPLGIDSEPDGKTNDNGMPPSACNDPLTVDCVEPAFGMNFGQDECFGDNDAGLMSPAVLVACQPAQLSILAYNCRPADREVYLNVCLDLNQDGDWNDNVLCPTGVCAYEWALKNVPVVLPPGCNTIALPPFLVGPNPGFAWLRVSLTAAPVPDDYPWAGSANLVGETFAGGETEDYPVEITGEEPCPEYSDFGDAPDDFTAYPSGVVGNFPTCIFPGLIGTRELACPPISTAPQATGYVEHRSTAGPQALWLGCGSPGVDPELDGKTNQVGGGSGSVCNQTILTDCGEPAFGASTYGQDECYGDGDAGVQGPIRFEVCRPETIRYEVFNCAADDVLYYLNVLVDWNEDGDWNDNFSCGIDPCVYEWVVKNKAIVAPQGCTRDSVIVMAGPNQGVGWMRVSVSFNPVTDDFPWDGTANAQPPWLDGGETEDYPVAIDPAGPPPCLDGYVDYGDAPELIPPYPGVGLSFFPTCLNPMAPGDYDDFCIPSAPAPPIGPTGFVRHIHPAQAPDAFWLGCGTTAQPWLGRDSELDGKMSDFAVTGLTSACAANVTVDCVESAFGLQFGQDECYGDLDAGLASFVALRACTLNAVTFTAFSCATGPRDVFVNVLVDLNGDGDWNDVMSCAAGGPVACPPEWWLRDWLVTLQPGCNTLTTPGIPVGAVTGPGWMRLTLSEQPAPPDFPWNGTASLVGESFTRGETEDYPVRIVPSTVDVGPPAPGRLWMGPLVPNPTRAGTMARFALPATAAVDLAAYDVGGRRVRTLFAGRMSAGEHVVTWNFADDDGRALPAGLYLVRLQVGGEELIRRVIRIR